ncbi:hypothetical protein EVJ58_g7009 [Rhodofomes roseus]|uniref:Uncharacterized protein n=1 Tax=Rhodofomes roseus TaxID=34475 RepID=A0A4Y9Y6P9_9APHY|nr:hypothetical protein EVJ58_g7009 [Rhodofomes roseus]
MLAYLHADDDAPNLGLNSNIMQVDAEIKAADCESIKSLTSLMMPPDSDGDADYRMHFMRSWWLIIRTVPYPARQRIHLNFIRMGWDLFARAHSEPIKTIMHEEDIDLVRLRFWDGAPVGGHNPGASRRICCFEVYRRFADGRVVQSQCGKEIRGDDAYWVTRVFELHMASHHLPQIRQEPQGTHFVSVTNCRWLYPDGMICDQMIKVHSDARRPCYALAQHVGKKTDHFALHLARCQREDCGCNKDFPSYDALARHHRRLE